MSIFEEEWEAGAFTECNAQKYKSKKGSKKKKILKSNVLSVPRAKPCGSLFWGACTNILTPESDSPRKGAFDSFLSSQTDEMGPSYGNFTF